VLGALLVAALLSAGCGAGKKNETESERSTPYSAQADAGSLAVRSVRLVAADVTTGTAQAYLLVSVINRGGSPDTLTNATVTGGTVAPGGGASSLTVPASESLRFGDPELGDTGPALEVSGLAQPLQLGTTVKVSLTFQSSGTVSLDAPVTASADVGTTATAAPIKTTGGYPSPSAGPTEP
jgi:hypothetical protein